MPLPNGMTHGEAYCLMAYQSQLDGSILMIWNSRDGVTPFIAFIDGIEHQHINWGTDAMRRNHVPAVGDYIFTDCDYDTWKAQEKAKVEVWWNHPKYPMSARWDTKEEALACLMKDFQPGQPMTVKVTQAIHDWFMAKAGQRYKPSTYTGPTRSA